MRAILFRYLTPFLALCCLTMLTLIITKRDLPSELFTAANIQSFKILFISIILEAFPFILLGVLFSALLQVFVTDELIKKLTRAIRLPAYCLALCLGFCSRFANAE